VVHINIVYHIVDMQVMSRKSALWNYLSPDLQGLIADGEVLMDFAEDYRGKVSDYSYLVFPFAKAYEGFLKNLFLDLGLMREDEFYGDEIRIGRILNPNFMENNSSLYKDLCTHKKGGEDVSKKLWKAWRKGRNQVFHYFPHNFRRLSLNEALEIVHELITAMDQSVNKCSLDVGHEITHRKASKAN